MRLVKIKNRYLYKSNDPNGVHTYAVYYDNKSKKNRAVGLTHLYVKDAKRFKQIAKGNIMVMKFKEFDVPSGVKNSYFDKNIHGKNIDLNDKSNVKFISQRYLRKVQSDKIKTLQKGKKSKRIPLPNF